VVLYKTTLIIMKKKNHLNHPSLSNEVHTVKVIAQ
jgi:hypothetical protein